MTQSISFKARRVLRNRRLLVAAASPLLLYIPLIASLMFGAYGQLLLLLHPLLLAAAAVFEVARRNPRPRLVEGDIRVEPETVELPDGTVLRRALLAQGFVTATDGGGARVTLFGPRIPIELQLESEERGRALLAALGLDASQTAVTFTGQSRVATLPLWTRVLGMIGAFLPAVAFLAFGVLRATVDRGLSSPGMLSLITGAFMIFAPLGPLALLARPARISVGVDGVAIVWLGRRRYVPFGRVESVEVLKPELGSKVSRGVALVLDDGERVPLPLSAASLVEGEAQRLQARIEQARAARTARSTHHAPVQRMAEDGHALVTSLRRSGLGAVAGPREGATDPERLLATLEDAGAPAAARAQAAIALCADGDEDSRARTLLAARQVASPRLRIAFERAAEQHVEDAALVEALAAIAEEEQAVSVRRR